MRVFHVHTYLYNWLSYYHYQGHYRSIGM